MNIDTVDTVLIETILLYSLVRVYPQKYDDICNLAKRYRRQEAVAFAIFVVYIIGPGMWNSCMVLLNVNFSLYLHQL